MTDDQRKALENLQAWLVDSKIGLARKPAQETVDAWVEALRAVSALAAPEPRWIVNDLGELGVEVGGRFFFLYKGDNIEYGTYQSESRGGIALHDDGTPRRYRIVGKREFGETQWPDSWLRRGYRDRLYTVELVFDPVLSFGKPEDGEWRDLPAGPAKTP